MSETKMTETINDFIKGNGFSIRVGQYEIRELNDGSFWIEHNSGEGMQIKKDTLEALITQWYTDNF